MQVTMLTSDEAIQEMVDNAIHAGLTCKAITGKQDEVIPKVYLGMLMEMGHTSVLEHITLSYKVEGVSRALLQELARHRHISLSVESTRHTLAKKLFSGDEDALEEVLDMIDDSFIFGLHGPYTDIYDTKEQAEEAKDIAEEAAELLQDYISKLTMLGMRARKVWDNKTCGDFLKYLLPEAYPTNLVLTLNLRELRHILALRTDDAALFEFQTLAYTLADCLPDELKWLVKDCIDPECTKRILEYGDVDVDIYDEDNEEDDEEDDGER